ncbi:IS1182 family transposase [Candidatus Woesearchaeota archaeon]|jgi:transposase|nr:IS1182 family transposase [Candidatus Woesearchaeota archaeon]
MAYMKSYPNQNYLLSPKISDMFSKNHVCYLIEHICNNMDYSEFDDKYAGAGHPAYHPRINLKLLAMSHVDSITSSRKIAKNAQENVVYIHLSEKVKPNWRTISDFRMKNEELVKECMKQLQMFAIEEGLIDLSHLSTDGTTIRANANDFKSIKKEQIKKIEMWIEKYMEEAKRVDEEENKIYGDKGMHELPENLVDPKRREPKVNEIVNRIKKAMKKKDTSDINQIKKEVQQVKQIMEQKNVKQYNFTDPDSRFMKSKKGRKELSYNAQLVTDKNGIIVANDVIQEREDRNQLVPNIELVEKNFGQLPNGTIITADAGYHNGKQLEILDNKELNLFVPGKGDNKTTAEEKEFYKINFTYDEEADEYICPKHKILTKRSQYIHSQKKVPMTIYAAKSSDCQACPKRQACFKSGNRREIHALPQDKLFNRIKEKLRTKEGKEIYAIRKQTVERSFGDIKYNKKFTNFLLRGLEKVKIEFDLACLAHNLVMINNLLKKRRVNLATSC